jgi:hypothetical protein
MTAVREKSRRDTNVGEVSVATDHRRRISYWRRFQNGLSPLMVQRRITRL